MEQVTLKIPKVPPTALGATTLDRFLVHWKEHANFMKKKAR